MKKMVPVLIVLILLTACSKKGVGSDLPGDYGDIVYTDSFSPVSYEYPLSRKVIPLEDVDIGIVINPDTTNPLYRAVYKTVFDLFNDISAVNDISGYFMESTYNSFRLRYKMSGIKKGYRLLVGEPVESSGMVMKVKFKIVTEDKKLNGSLELTRKDESYLISDYENTGFDELLGVSN